MASSTNKKVQIYRFDREPVFGFVNPAAYLTAEGVELLNLTGSVTVLPYGDVKTIVYVRDFDTAPYRRTFANRPKVDGLWVRLVFRDGDVLEGIVANNLLQIESVGLSVIPPDSNQKVFVPRAALTAAQVLGVVGSPLRGTKKKVTPKEQIDLFDQQS